MSEFDTNTDGNPLDNTAPKHNFAVLKLYVNMFNTELVNLYKEHVEKHDNALKTTKYPNSGFDLFVPEDVSFTRLNKTNLIDMQVKGEMVFYDATANTIETCAYMLFPRSSISKTPLMLANHTGIIDSGYRGSLIGAFRSLTQWNYIVAEGTRLLQVCHPTLCPVYVVIVNEDDLTTTERGAGGFGSTG
jgi:dUTP pyrophosphatase